MLCHDQEPLNYDLHNNPDKIKEYLDFIPALQKTYPLYSDLNIAFKTYHSWQKKWVLLHSELNSPEVVKYESTGHYVGAYWWSHAIISRDWYRYAEYDPSLNYTAPYKKMFLIYCRDSTGSRTYRTAFIQQLKETVNLDNVQLGSVHGNLVDSAASASYDVDDFVSTDISIVLETVADQRIHLTEKTLRPIACGHPFMIIAGPGTLALLKKYGFETFSPWINEEYDNETDLSNRINLVVNEMKRLSLLGATEKELVLRNCQEITRRNKNYFFSQQFQDAIISELKHNVNLAFNLHQGAIDQTLIDYIHNWRKQNLLKQD